MPCSCRLLPYQCLSVWACLCEHSEQGRNLELRDDPA
ncbi:hypothetical protein ACHAXN_000753 [Cyclotella atomus]